MWQRGKTVNTKMCCHGKMSFYGRERGHIHELVSSWNVYYRYLFIDTATSSTRRQIIIAHGGIIIYRYILVDSTIITINTC